jgi:hypothetical protein
MLIGLHDEPRVTKRACNLYFTAGLILPVVSGEITRPVGARAVGTGGDLTSTATCKDRCGLYPFRYGCCPGGVICNPLGKLVRVAWALAFADGHGNYCLTIRSTAWFTSSRAFFLADSRRVSSSLFSNRLDWRCDLSSLVRFFAMLIVSHSQRKLAIRSVGPD